MPHGGEQISHRKLVKHFHEPGHLHEFTFSCYQRRPLLTDPERLPTLSRCIDDASSELGYDLIAFVYMTEHVHLLVHPRQLEPNLGRYLARLKQPFSKDVKHP